MWEVQRILIFVIRNAEDATLNSLIPFSKDLIVKVFQTFFYFFFFLIKAAEKHFSSLCRLRNFFGKSSHSQWHSSAFLIIIFQIVFLRLKLTNYKQFILNGGSGPTTVHMPTNNCTLTPCGIAHSRNILLRNLLLNLPEYNEKGCFDLLFLSMSAESGQQSQHLATIRKVRICEWLV